MSILEFYLAILFLQIEKNAMKTSDKFSRVRNEVEIHSRLKHPAVLELYSYFEDRNYVYLVLELCHNGALDRFLKTTKLTETEGEVTLLWWLMQVVY